MEETEYLPRRKRQRRSATQILLDLGPLLQPVLQRTPGQLYKATYINLDIQMEDEQIRQRLMRKEEQFREMLVVDSICATRDLNVRFEKMQRWTLMVVERRQLLTLRVMGQVQWAEVHIRSRVVQQEGLEWQHLLEYLILAQKRMERRWLKGERGMEWANLLTSARVGRSLILTQQQADSVRKVVIRKERKSYRKMVENDFMQLHTSLEVFCSNNGGHG